MTYVFDTSPFSALFKSFYRGRFPSLWRRFDALIGDGTILSTREVRRELEQYGVPECQQWLRDNGHVFTTPTAQEGVFVSRIYAVPHFQQNIELRKLQKGGLCADPFVVAKAAVCQATVVTLESAPAHGARIPNICEHFGVECCDLEQFMENENWIF